MIFATPLSISPWKSVWAFTRLIAMIPSAAAAFASRCAIGPSGTRPSSTVSMVASIGMPTASSVTPRLASISSWPSAVAPPCDPMAGTTNGSAPSSRSHAPASRTTSGLSWMPRLPAVSATRIPAVTRPRNGSRASRVAAATSRTWGASNFCRTGSSRGKGAS